MNAKDYLELKSIINYNIQHTCWGLVQNGSSKMYVFMTVTLHISTFKRWIQWTFVIANITSNKFLATSNNFHSPIILDHDNSYNIHWYIEYCFLRIPCYNDRKNKKTGLFIKLSYWAVFPFPNLNVVYFEHLSRSNLSNIKFQGCSTVIVWQL